jgi:phosphohistidine phosphatase SixA
MLPCGVMTRFHKTRLGARSSALVVALWCAVSALPQHCWGQEHEAAVGQVTIVLVRHAERAEDDPRDPSLSEAGQQRADELARVVGDLHITHLFATQYKRTQQTLSPLARKSGIDIEARAANEPEAFIAELRGLPDAAVVVVAGHSNTVPDLVKRLGGEPSGLEEDPKHGWLLPHDEYSRMYVVTLVRGAAHELKFGGCLELRYGDD